MFVHTHPTHTPVQEMHIHSDVETQVVEYPTSLANYSAGFETF